MIEPGPERDESWARTVAEAGSRLQPTVHGALENVARLEWADADPGDWCILSAPTRATWQLARWLGTDDEGRHRYARIEVVATVDPKGELVTWQVNNGAEFLGLTDLSAYGIQRGAIYLLEQKYREWLTDEPLFERQAESSSVTSAIETIRGKLARLFRG